MVGQTETVDKVLIEMGIPLNNIKWTNEDPENYSYAPVDEDTRITLIDMEKLKDKAHQTEDYEMLNQITKDLKVVYDLGNEILNLKRELEFATAKEDYNKAIELRNRLKQLEQERDKYDALYETSRYEDMIVMPRPTSAQRRLAKKLEDEERARLEAIKRQQEREAEEERLRRLREEEERERLRREEEDRKNRQTTMKTVKKKNFNTVSQTKTVEVKRNALEYNESDDDLAPYLNSKLAGLEKPPDLETSVLKRAERSGTLLVTGVALWSALRSELWSHRNAAAEAFKEYLLAPLKPKYIGKTRRLFRAAIDVAKEATGDKLIQIYHVGLEILKIAMRDPICGDDVTAKDINSAIRYFVPLLIDKISELNFKVKEFSLSTLVKLFENNLADIRILIDGIMDITDKGPQPDQAPWRIILARLEILTMIIQTFGIDENVWNWDIVYEKLVIPSFFNQNKDVRDTATLIALELYRIVGAPIKEMTNTVENIKPNLLQTINAEFDKHDETVGGKYYQNTDLNQIPEATEEQQEDA